jgi:hypothetical protein
MSPKTLTAQVANVDVITLTTSAGGKGDNLAPNEARPDRGAGFP